MIALVLFSLCIGGIVGHRWDNLLFKPLMGLVGDDVTPVISKAMYSERQDPDEDVLLTELGDESDKGGNVAVNANGNGARNGDGIGDGNGATVMQRRKADNRKNLLQHLYTDYSYLRSAEGWMKSNENIDFDMLIDRSFDCKRFQHGLDELPSAVVPELYAHIHPFLPDGRKVTPTAEKVKGAMIDHKYLNFSPVSYYADIFKDLQIDTSLKDVKRAGTSAVIGCDCKVKIDLVDLGQQHYPRYLMNAVCQSTNQSPNEYPQKCWRGTHCKPLEYKVKVLTPRTILDQAHSDPALAWLPDELRQNWKFKTITVAAGCFCSY